jgi:hypothetical protein
VPRRMSCRPQHQRNSDCTLVQSRTNFLALGALDLKNGAELALIDVAQEALFQVRIPNTAGVIVTGDAFDMGRGQQQSLTTLKTASSSAHRGFPRASRKDVEAPALRSCSWRRS